MIHFNFRIFCYVFKRTMKWCVFFVKLSWHKVKVKVYIIFVLPQKKVGFSLGTLTSSLSVNVFICIRSTWPCDMLLQAALQFAGGNVIFFMMQDGKLKYLDQIQETRVSSAAFNFSTEFFLIMQLVCAWTCVCMRIWLSLWAQSNAACWEATKRTPAKSYLKRPYLNKMARRPDRTAGCCLFFFGSVYAAENVPCAVVAKEVEDVFLERANKIKAAAAAETQMTHVSTLI